MFINTKTIFILFLSAVSAYILSCVLFLALPKTGVNLESKNIFTDTSSKKLNISNLFIDSTNKASITQTNSKLLDNVELLALYDLGNEGGYIVMKEKTSQTTHILEKNEIYRGYKLIMVLKKYALFEKSNKQYKLPLKTGKEIKYKGESI